MTKAAEAMTADDWEHLFKLIGEHNQRTTAKYINGKAEHGGELWKKSGLLGRALDEAVDLPVYLWSLRDRMKWLVEDIKAGTITLEGVAVEIERWLEP